MNNRNRNRNKEPNVVYEVDVIWLDDDQRQITRAADRWATEERLDNSRRRSYIKIGGKRWKPKKPPPSERRWK
jgi:hypothetical protein